MLKKLIVFLLVFVSLSENTGYSLGNDINTIFSAERQYGAFMNADGTATSYGEMAFNIAGKVGLLGLNFIGASALSKAGNFSNEITWGPHTTEGPLGQQTVNTFRGGTYVEKVVSEPVILYRNYGGTAGEIGNYWTATQPSGPMQSIIDSALLPRWGNTAESISAIRVPTGTTIYEGFAAPQGGLVGGGNQVFIPKVDPKWLIK